ncbi:B3 domain-containing protein At1g05920-like [Cucurbita pepo subsp. pepo]|uniref:B3 domain-containing protein At1g05920-like n=1 Tax=Cucurbita pepo subsp. pepo TaxID=3664 RepID=UPI000C9D42A7|nr:B3 domain-containing protein At1g05920-like [Cucurbita pepo subsp. pepo]
MDPRLGFGFHLCLRLSRTAEMAQSGVVSKTLDLISSFGLDTNKRKNRDCDDEPKRKRRREMVFSSTVEMPAALRERIEAMGGTDVQLVTQKQLQESDRNKNHGRLLIPTKKLMNDFATEEEAELMMQEEVDRRRRRRIGMQVAIIDSALRETVIGLKLWKIGSGHNYCLASRWNSFAEQNSLESGDYIQLWSFRSNNNAFIVNDHTLCFALVKLDISEGIFNFI